LEWNGGRRPEPGLLQAPFQPSASAPIELEARGRANPERFRCARPHGTRRVNGTTSSGVLRESSFSVICASRILLRPQETP
jgi:hypothetical protein